jgi:4-hydroxy-tetrahydrodipicolinate reductase
VEITSHRIGDAAGEHIVTAAGEGDELTIRHVSHNRRGFALGAVRAAEWLAGKAGVWEFREIVEQL